MKTRGPGADIPSDKRRIENVIVFDFSVVQSMIMDLLGGSPVSFGCARDSICVGIRSTSMATDVAQSV